MSIHLRTYYCLLTWLLLSCVPAHAQAGSDAGDQYLKGYQLKNEGEQFETAGKMDAAIARYQQALQIISGVAQNFPTWQPEVVRFRIQALQKKLDQLKLGGAANPPVAVLPAQPPPPLPYQPIAPASLPAAPYPPSYTQPLPPAPGGIPADPFAALRQAMEIKDEEIRRRDILLGQKNSEIQKVLTDSEIVKGAYIAQTAAKQKAELDVATLAQQSRDLQAKLAAAEAEVKHVKAGADAESQAKLAASQQELKRLRAEKALVEGMVAEKSAALEEIKKALASAEKDRDALKENATKIHAENNTLQAQNKVLQAKVGDLERTGVSGGEAYAKLVAENARFKTELESARKQIEELKGSSASKDTEIARLKAQVTSIQGELAKVQSENIQYQKDVADLTVKLKEMNSSLATAQISGAAGQKEGQLTEENKMLRAIITRQLRNQERRRQAKEMVVADMQKMKNASRTLLQNLEDLTSTRVMITAEEESLFTKPQIDLIYSFENNPSNRATLVSVSSKKDRKGAAAPDAAAGGSTAAVVEKLLAQASSAVEKQDYKKAEAAYQDALRADPKNPDMLTSYGILELRLKKYEDAEVQLRKALVYDPDNADALYRLGACYYYEGRMDDSRQQFELSLQKKPENAKAHHYLGIIAGKNGKRDVAEAEFKQALAIDPNYGDAHFNLAVLYATHEPPDWIMARQYYQSALAKGIKPDPSMEKLLKGRDVSNAGALPATLDGAAKDAAISAR